jgi:hypothetical protein
MDTGGFGEFEYGKCNRRDAARLSRNQKKKCNRRDAEAQRQTQRRKKTILNFECGDD